MESQLDAFSPRSEFEACLEVQEGRAVLGLAGELDVSALPVLRRMIASALDGRPAAVVVDMDQVTFVDAAGFGGLVAAAAASAERGCRLTVRRPQPAPARTLRLLDVDDVLAIERS
ncbi:MAG TPA: STAS domain-containing protein [Acidimicrobiales bacterium]|nr:STAS domain-containing protein [Acidimicrobiales bacterium]